MGCLKLSILRERKGVQVVKTDGEVIGFKRPILVKELLVDFDGFGVKSSREGFEALAPSYELQLGKTYYLFPCRLRPVPAAAVKRIKVVITRKQFEELLSKKTSMEKIVFGVDKACSSELAPTIWKPNLVPIPEENEFINM